MHNSLALWWQTRVLCSSWCVPWTTCRLLPTDSEVVFVVKDQCVEDGETREFGLGHDHAMTSHLETTSSATGKVIVLKEYQSELSSQEKAFLDSIVSAS